MSEAQSRYRRSRKPTIAAPIKILALPAGVAKERVDKVLSLLHVCGEASTDRIAVLMSLHKVIISPVVAHLSKQKWLVEEVSGPKNAKITVWKLTNSGAKEAVFAYHRDKSRCPRTFFAGGVNPWTGVNTRILAKTQ